MDALDFKQSQSQWDSAKRDDFHHGQEHELRTFRIREYTSRKDVGLEQDYQQ